jgi:hypothetical protein
MVYGFVIAELILENGTWYWFSRSDATDVFLPLENLVAFLPEARIKPEGGSNVVRRSRHSEIVSVTEVTLISR